ncbi:MAG TPA: galactokinase [Anaerolineales bacterium]|nr:galactokinase [Anaerolineales bacterium]
MADHIGDTQVMELVGKFRQIYGRQPTVVSRAPGRVNMLGEHVDYNQGVVMPAAIDRAVTLAAAPSEDGIVTLNALDLIAKTSFRLSEIHQRCDVDGKPLAGWALYPAGVAWSLLQAGASLNGMEVVFTSDVPIGAGLSSSAAVEVAFATTFQAISGFSMDRLTMARLCQKAENEYVGVSSGLMDQFASAFGVEGHVLCFDTRSLEWETYALPAHTAIVIADSGIRRSLANSAYNARRSACEQAVELLKRYLPGIQSLRDVSTVELAAYSTYLPPEIARRAEHVVKEIHRVEQATIALKRGDAQLFGGYMFASHKSLRDLYEVSLPELDSLVEIARRLPGIYGARLTGAGFGGCTVNLVEEKQADSFIQALQAGYRMKTGRETTVYLCRASDGAQARVVI